MKYNKILRRSDTPPVRLVLKPGQRGTIKLIQQYGSRLICARYRYDPVRKKRLKTAEIVIEEKYWKPASYDMVVPNIPVSISVEPYEIDIRQKVKSAGGSWNPVEKVWHLPLPKVFELDLENRIVDKKHL